MALLTAIQIAGSNSKGYRNWCPFLVSLVHRQTDKAMASIIRLKDGRPTESSESHLDQRGLM